MPTPATMGASDVHVACAVTFIDVPSERMACAVYWRRAPTGSVASIGLTEMLVRTEPETETVVDPVSPR